MPKNRIYRGQRQDSDQKLFYLKRNSFVVPRERVKCIRGVFCGSTKSRGEKRLPVWCCLSKIARYWSNINV